MAGRKNRKTIDDIAYGIEPTAPEKEATLVQISKALSWYGAMQKNDDAYKYLVAHDKRAKRIPKASIVSTLGFSIRMIDRGWILPEKTTKRINNDLEFLFSKYENNEEQKEDTPEKKKLTVQDRVRAQADIFSAELDGMIDDFIKNKYRSKFDTYEWLQENEVKQPHCKIIADNFEPMLEELIEAWNGDDEQLVEAYAHLTDKQFGDFINFVKSIIEDCKRFATNAKKTKAPRKKKAVNVEKIISRLKYKKEDTELKIASVDPAKIIGANQVWLFNTKYRILQVLNADGPVGLSIKGMAIKGFDGNSSIMKTVRKPADVCKRVLDGGKIVLRKLMGEINSKERVAQGRLNEHVVILRVI